MKNWFSSRRVKALRLALHEQFTRRNREFDHLFVASPIALCGLIYFGLAGKLDSLEHWVYGAISSGFIGLLVGGLLVRLVPAVWGAVVRPYRQFLATYERHLRINDALEQQGGELSLSEEQAASQQSDHDYLMNLAMNSYMTIDEMIQLRMELKRLRDMGDTTPVLSLVERRSQGHARRPPQAKPDLSDLRKRLKLDK